MRCAWLLTGLLLGCEPGTANVGAVDDYDSGVVSGDDDDNSGDDDDTVTASGTDADSDGFDVDEDCDDNNAAINPNADERCNGVDDNCDEVVDENDVCPCETREYEGVLYSFCEDDANWSQAHTICLTAGMDLAAINDQAENDWVHNAIDNLGGWTWFFGLSDQAVEGVWEWSNGDPVDFEHWNNGEPNDWMGYGPAGEDCGEMLTTSGRWNDSPCDQPSPFVCEAL